jgi:alkylated DNA repair dioxygenase AlkB
MCSITNGDFQAYDSTCGSAAKPEWEGSSMVDFRDFSYWGAAVSPAKARIYMDGLKQLSLSRVKMRGRETLRLIGQFGGNVYKYHGGIAHEPTPFTPLLTSMREEVAEIAGISAESLIAATVQYYPEGAGIGWHIDDPRYGVVLGLSLGGACEMAFRRPGARGIIGRELGHGSVYVLDGCARWAYQHRVPPVRADRYSVTFRTLYGSRV